MFSMSKITKYLNQLITGNVFDSPEILEAYSTDRSALKITPKIVAIPESTKDIQKLMQFVTKLSKDIRIPVAVRGSGLDEMGADLSSGIVISMEKLNHLQEIDPRERLVRVQAGITLKELNTALKVSGLTIPIKANDNETIGSLIANCPTDAYAAKYGGIVHYVERAEIILANGECIQTDRLNLHTIAKKAKEKTLEGEIYSKLSELVKNNKELINLIKTTNTGSAGYPTISYATKKDTLNLLPLMFSSEGTLGVITEVILHAEVIQPTPTRLIATFSNLKSTLNFLVHTVTMKPLELNVVDLRILKTAEEYGKNLSKITKKLENGYAVFISFDEKSNKANHKLRECVKYIPKTSSFIMENADTADVISEFENSITSFLNLPGAGERIPLLSNFYVPANNLVSFLKDLSVLEQKLRIELPLFGSFAASNYSLRPKIKLNEPKADQKIYTLLKAGNLIITRNSGSLTGGSPEGRIKAVVTNTAFNPEEKSLYESIKQIFDPNGLLNPDAKLGTNLKNTVSHLRTTKTPNTVL